MNFSRPGTLFLLVLALLPPAIYLAFRSRARRDFSSLSILRSVYERSIVWWRIRQIVVISLRVAAVAALVLAFAGPSVRSLRPFGGFSQAKRSFAVDVVLLADTSYSMRAKSAGRDIFDIVRGQGLEIIKALQPGDRVAVGAFSDRWEGPPLAWTQDFDAARAKLNGLESGWRCTDYGAALNRAAAFMDSEAGGKAKKAVILLTDGAGHGSKSGRYQKKIPVYAALASGGHNAWINSAGLSGGEGGAADRVILQARLGLSGEWNEDVKASLSDQAGQRAPRYAARSGHAAAAAAAWSIGTKPPSNWYGKISLGADSLETDNNYYFSYRVPLADKLLCLYGDPEFKAHGRAGHFINSALNPSEGSSLISCDFADIAGMSGGGLANYKGVVLGGVKRLSREQADMLSSYVVSGGRLLILFSGESEPGGLRHLSGIMPADVEGVEKISGGSLVNESGNYSGFELDKLDFRGIMRLRPAKNAVTSWVLTQAGRQYPAFVEGKSGRGAVFMWAPGLETDWSNFSLKPVFPVWLAETAVRLAGTALKPVFLGGYIGTCALAKADTPAPVTLLGPDGAMRGVSAAKDGKLVFDCGLPGLYQFCGADCGEPGAWTRFAVNLNTASGESDLSVDPSPAWKALDALDPAGSFLALAGGGDIRFLFFLFACLAFLAEFFIAGVR